MGQLHLQKFNQITISFAVSELQLQKGIDITIHLENYNCV